MLADMAMKIEAGRRLYQQAAWMAEQGPALLAGVLLRQGLLRGLAMEVTTNAVQVHGGYGYMKEYLVEKLMRDAKIMQIYEGTAQIQRLVIAGNLMGVTDTYPWN